jgi:hypothetical protein
MTYPWTAGEVLLAADLNSALAAKTDTAMTQNAQTGTSYSYVLADAAKLLSMSNAASNTVLVTKQATVTWVTGTQLRVMNLGAGVTTLVADTGVTINGNVALKQYQGGELIRTASDVWLFVPTASSSGMDLITPTSVAGSGVTLSGGEVSFSAASTVSVNGCFTSAYDNYQIVLRVTGSAGINAFMRMRASGSDTATNYVSTLSQLAATYSSTNATTSFEYGILRAVLGMYVLNLSGPNLAAITAITATGLDANTLSTGMICNGRQTDSTQFDGFSLFGNTGTATGKLRIYGLRNS